MEYASDQALRDLQFFGEEGGVVPVIDVASTSTFLDPHDMQLTFKGEMPGCYLYSRHSNPTVSMLGKKLAALEDTEAGLGVASGMAAIMATVLQLTKRGDHVVSSRTVYGGTYAAFHNLLPRFGIEITFVDPSNTKAFAEAIRPNTKVVYTETLSNPLLAVSDLPALSQLAKDHNCKLVVDNTFTPTIIHPSTLGADVVIHSCTKFISGASDLIAGAICCSEEFANQLINLNDGMVMLLGPTMDARVAHSLILRLDHLHIRMKAHSETAQLLAEEMERRGIPTVYPGLKSHPQYGLFESLKNRGAGYSSIITMDCGSGEKARSLATLLQAKKFGLYAVSLGFSRTLMSRPATSTSSEIPDGDQAAMGMTPGLLRLSVGFSGDTPTMIKRFFDSFDQI
jgi:methionine-gamma-lyase